MSDPCRGCSRAGETICSATFRCQACGKDRNVCAYLPGGLEAFTESVTLNGSECVICLEKRTMGEAWVNKWHRKMGGGGV